MPSKHSSALSLGPAGQEHQLCLLLPGIPTRVCSLPTQGQVSRGLGASFPPDGRSSHPSSLPKAERAVSPGGSLPMTVTSPGAQGTCTISQAALLGALAEGGGALQGAALVLVLEDG